MPAKRGAREVLERDDSQASLTARMERQRLDSGGSSGSDILSASPFKITVCIFKDAKNDDYFAPQNTMFAYTKENEAEVKKKLSSIRRMATTQSIAHDIITVEAITTMPPSVIGGLTSGYIYKAFKDDANG